ncbi:hypothetical protein QKU48_gp0432 [Fadolivirus algeromassiliense]|jgi:hypothetical protein|uniref:Uncharacterized protein n=1 Tax=Fadolivirus FV1/VV64 TaxID=3070911 RepID=A0A7D3USW8_9VIRU|nr:hypothetical protein QKU48_gp0432 [Fadolivirus algeromassiliense]QKF93890.1 hypothetical protein Fadolivirus_1_432 [Fadolivirus FV1/VV64]
MRIALLLRGIAYNKYYSHPTGKKLLIDYIKSINNYKEYIYENNDVDIFFVTYYNDFFDIDKILDIYKPICYEFITDPERNIGQIKNKYNSYSQTTIYVINLFLAYCAIHNIDDYDYIIITRFDLLFKIKLSTLKLEKDKFMISCLAGNNLMDDNFFITNKHYLKEYLEVLSQRNKYHMMHQDYLALCDKIGKDNVKFLIPGIYSIHNGNPLYNILRYHLEIDIFHNATLLIYNKITNKFLNYNTSDNKVYVSNYPGKFSIKTVNNKHIIGIFDKQSDLVLDKTNLILVKNIVSHDTIISITKKDNESYLDNLRLQNSDKWIIFPTTFI